MVLLYESRDQRAHYRVTRAGRSVRLYKNGIFHTQYNPHNVFTGSVWDLLSIPVLFATSLPQSVLMLGVGGGGAIHQLHALAQPDRITGIEIDPVHIRIAKRFFDLDDSKIQFIQADAINWVRVNHRRRFDLVVDDIFIESENPVRPMEIDRVWLERVTRLVSASGMLIQNHASMKGVTEVLRDHRDFLKHAYSNVLVFQTESCANAVLVAYRGCAHARARQRVDVWLRERFGADSRRIRYNVRQLV